MPGQGQVAEASRRLALEGLDDPGVQECVETTNKLSELDAILMKKSQEALVMMKDMEKEVESLQQPCGGSNHQFLWCRNGLLFECRLEGEVVHRVGDCVQGIRPVMKELGQEVRSFVFKNWGIKLGAMKSELQDLSFADVKQEELFQLYVWE